MPCKEKYATKPATPRISLRKACPDVAKQWHPTKNGDLTPDDVSKYSRLLVWWQCPNGHEWQQAIPGFVRFGHCQICRKEASSLTQWCKDNNRPDLLTEWHPTRNPSLSPNSVSSKSNVRVWWKCKRGHEWNTKLSNRTCQGSDCPYCHGRYSDTVSEIWKTCPVCGYEWRIIKGSAKDKACPKCHPLNQRRKPKFVKHVETGKIYTSVTEASDKLGIDHSTISKCCLGIRNSTHNQHFVYIDANSLQVEEYVDMKSHTNRINGMTFTKPQLRFLEYSIDKCSSDEDYAKSHNNCTEPLKRHYKTVMTYTAENKKTGITAMEWAKTNKLTLNAVSASRHYLFKFIDTHKDEFNEYRKYGEVSSDKPFELFPSSMTTEKDPVVVELPFTYGGQPETDDTPNESILAQENLHSNELSTRERPTMSNSIVLHINDVYVEMPQDIDLELLKSIIRTVRES